MKIYVLRLDHRKRRDARITTHVCLSARAFGASGIILSGDEDSKLVENVQDVVKRWGGRFEVVYRENWQNFIEEWKNKKGELIHLTMYGSPIQEVLGRIKDSPQDKLVVVGGARVPSKVFKQANWNVSITSQPHSEVSALAIFLHMFCEGRELEIEFKRGILKVLPSEDGKKVITNFKDE